MYRLLEVLLVAAAVAFSGCSGARVSTDYDPETNFASLRTWGWGPRDTAAKSDGEIPDPLRDERIERSIAELLVDRGFPMADDGSADFLVVYHVIVEESLEYTEVPVPLGYWGYWGGFYGRRAYVDSYPKRRLLIDVLGSDGETLLWRGVGVERLRDYSSPRERAENIRSTVSAILARFPPRQQ